MKTVKITDEKKQNFFMKEAYATLRTNILFSATGVKVVAFTGCTMGEGKSTVVLALAKSFAELGKRVLLIDADLRKSTLATRVQEPIEMGLSAYLSAQADRESVIYKTQYPTLDLVFAGRFPPNPIELLNSPKMNELLAFAREAYDVVLIDTPPLGMVVDCIAISPLCDGTVVVLKADETRTRQAQKVVDDLRSKGCTVLGAVLNHATPAKGLCARLKRLFARRSSGKN